MKSPRRRARHLQGPLGAREVPRIPLVRVAHVQHHGPRPPRRAAARACSGAGCWLRFAQHRAPFAGCQRRRARLHVTGLERFEQQPVVWARVCNQPAVQAQTSSPCGNWHSVSPSTSSSNRGISQQQKYCRLCASMSSQCSFSYRHAINRLCMTDRSESARQRRACGSVTGREVIPPASDTRLGLNCRHSLGNWCPSASCVDQRRPCQTQAPAVNNGIASPRSLKPSSTS